MMIYAAICMKKSGTLSLNKHYLPKIIAVMNKYTSKKDFG